MMVIKWIPLKNVLLDEETTYLNNQLSKGLVLRRKGLIFYHFNHDTNDRIDSLNIEILFVNNHKKHNSTDSSDETLLTEKKYLFTNKKKYYLLTNKNKRWLFDETSLLKWYQSMQGRYLAFGNFFGCLSALLFVMVMTPFNIPTFIFLLLPFFVFFAIPNFKKSSFCFSEVKRISYEMGKLTGFEPEYILSFFEPITEKFEKELASLGYFKKVNAKIYKIKTPLTKSELVDFIVEADNLKPVDFNVDQLGELYILI